MLRWYCLRNFCFSALVTIPVVLVVTGMTKHFIFHIRYISRRLYFSFFSVSFWITFLSDGIATSVNK